jgi:hypothetical protein
MLAYDIILTVVYTCEEVYVTRVAMYVYVREFGKELGCRKLQKISMLKNFCI